MVVHMIRVWSEPPKNDNHLTKMRSACEDWTGRYSETLTTDRLAIEHVHLEEAVSEHTTGWWRFEWHEDAVTLLNELESDLQNEVKWYRIRYHACDHDGSDNGGCSWDESQTREYGAVPQGIP